MAVNTVFALLKLYVLFPPSTVIVPLGTLIKLDTFPVSAPFTFLTTTSHLLLLAAVAVTMAAAPAFFTVKSFSSSTLPTGPAPNVILPLLAPKSIV